MHIILLKFSTQRARARDFMAAHNDWLREGFDAGVFLMSGSIQPSAGGAILAHNATRDEIAARVAADPFVVESVVSAEIVEVTPSRLDARLSFLEA